MKILKSKNANVITNPLKVILLMGVSGSGKSYLASQLVNYKGDITFVLPTQVTTRPQREIEKSDDYLFINNEYYDKLNKEERLICRTEFNGYKYGTLINTLVTGSNIWNVIVVNKKGMEDFYKYLDIPNTSASKYYDNYRIYKVLVLSDLNEEILKEHNNRDLTIAQNELMELLTIEYDRYINNYEHDRCTLDRFVNKIFE